MKKFNIAILIVIIFMLLNSCKLGDTMRIKDGDHQKAQELIENVLKAIENKDDEKLKALFSQAALDQIPSHEESIDDLFNYFSGSVESFDDGAGPYVETIKEENFIFQLMESSFIVKTDTCEYRFAMQYITRGNAADIGITSMYIIKTTDDENLDYTYWGDGKFTPGIHIGMHNVV